MEIITSKSALEQHKEQDDLKRYKYLTFISMLYLACELASLVLTYKIVDTRFFFGAASSFIFPITYTWNDIITEVYGYKVSKKIIWYVFGCDSLFVLLTLLSIHTPSQNLSQQMAYENVLGPLWQALSSEMLGVLSGAFINSVIISRWKIFTKGKQFWVRSIVSSAIGEWIMLVISVPLALCTIMDAKHIIDLIINAYLYKIIFAILVAGPANYMASLLKMKEGIDIFDYNVKYNPFIRD